VILHVGALLPFCEYFVICAGRSPVHCEAICDRVDELLREAGMKPHHREGARQGEWTILDYSDVVLHVFSESARRFYDLERLWAEAPRLEPKFAAPPEEAG
jgi:ribosome-associated protein